MQEYLSLQSEVMGTGHRKGDRTKTGTISKPGLVRRYDIRNERPAIVTTKKLHLKTGLVEEQWMMSGDTDVAFLKENNCNIWDEWVNDPNAVYRPRTLKEMKRVYRRNHFGWGTPAVLDLGWDHATKPNCELVGEFDGFNIYHYPATDVSEPEHVVLDTTPGSENWMNWATQDNDIWMKFYLALGISDQEVVSGDLGAVYGKMFRNIDDTRMIEPGDDAQYLALRARGFTYMGSMTPVSDDVTTKDIYHRRIDQVSDLLRMMEKDPDSRRLILCPWNPAYLDEQALPPCHSFIQFWTRDLSADERYDIYSQRIKRMDMESRINAAANPECFLSNSYLGIAPISKAFFSTPEQMDEFLDKSNVPKKALTCMLFQR